MQRDYDRRDAALPSDLRHPRNFFVEHALNTDIFKTYQKNRIESKLATKRAQEAAQEAAVSSAREVEPQQCKDTGAMSWRYPLSKPQREKAGFSHHEVKDKGVTSGVRLQSYPRHRGEANSKVKASEERNWRVGRNWRVAEHTSNAAESEAEAVSQMVVGSAEHRALVAAMVKGSKR